MHPPATRPRSDSHRRSVTVTIPDGLSRRLERLAAGYGADDDAPAYVIRLALELFVDVVEGRVHLAARRADRDAPTAGTE